MRSAIATIAALLFLHGASQAATAPEDTLLVPGERVGKVTLGMTAAEVEERLGKPTKEKEDFYMEYSDKDGILDIFFTNHEVNEIRFNNKAFKTTDGLSLATFTQKRFHSDFNYARMQTKFMNTRQILKSGGLAMYKLDIDGAAGVKTTTVGLVYKERLSASGANVSGRKGRRVGRVGRTTIDALG